MKSKWILILLTVLLSCATDKKAEIKDADLTVQVTVNGSKNEKVYKVRIFYEFKGGEYDRKHFTEQMQYRMDSCFYYSDAASRQYPDGVVQVANGIKNCFEYILVFNNPQIEKEAELNYIAKYINNKTYQLSLK